MSENPGGPAPRLVVLLPGTLVPPSTYAAVEALLADGGGHFETLVFDWGQRVPEPTLETVAEAVAVAISEADRGPAILVGHSTGGAIAARTALSHAGTVAGLVLIDSGPNMHGHGSVERMIADLRSAATEADWRAYAELNTATGAPAHREAWIAAMVDYSRALGPGPAVSILSSQHATDFLTEVGTHPAAGLPVQVLHGELDPKRKPVDSRAWQGVFPEAEFELVPGCGHTPPLEAPREVAASIRRVDERIGEHAAG